MKEAKLYEKLKNKAVRCLACKHYCIIPEGKTGICSIRGNENGKLFLYTYSTPAAIAVDPIEKKPLFHYRPGSRVFSIGTFGCNFRCSFCQNWDLSQYPKQEAKREAKKANVLIKIHSVNLTPEDAVSKAILTGYSGIAYTYNEPTIWSEYAEETAELAHKQGLFNVFVSSGYESEEALDFLKHIDAYNIDLKAFTDRFYKELCGTKLDNVLETIKSIYRRKKWMEITTLIIPGENDSEEELRNIASFIKELSPSIPWHVSAFHPDYKMLDKPPTPLSKLEEAYNIGKEEGLEYIYVGNVYTEDKENTYCPKCNTLLIKRRGFEVVENNLISGHCPKCNYKISGVFN